MENFDQYIRVKLDDLYSKLQNQDLKQAKKIYDSILDNKKEMITEQLLFFLLQSCTFFIDLGLDYKNIDILDKGKFICEYALKKINEENLDTPFEFEIRYNLSNYYSNMGFLEFENYSLTDIAPKISYTNQWSVKIREQYEIIQTLKSCVNKDSKNRFIVNYSLFLMRCGRFIEALDWLNTLDKKEFAPAELSKYNVLYRYGVENRFLKEGTRQATHKYVYQNYLSILENPTKMKQLEAIMSENISENIKKKIKNLENGYNGGRSFLLENIPKHKHNWNYDFTDKFVKNCQEKHLLFLNEQLFDTTCSSHCYDDLKIDLENLNFDSAKKKKLYNYSNQIKQKYITARYSIIQAEIPESDIVEINKLTDYFDELGLLETNDFSLSRGLKEQGFQTAFNVLDSVINFINEFLDLRITRFSELYFDKNKIFRKNGRFNEEIENENSYYLFAIYDLSLDFQLNGRYKYLSKIRNELTHSFLERNIQIADFYKILEICRSVIFYLFMWVNSKKSV